MSSPIQTICVCGAGTMGSGIAQVAAQAGYTTMLYDLDLTVLEKAKERIESSLQYLLSKNKISSGEKNTIAQRIRFSNDWQQCKADIIIEAIIEKADIKIELFKKLASINTATTIFATNTSSLSVTHIAEALPNPGRFIGMHFFNPAPVMKLVEVVNTSYTNEEVTRAVVELAEKMNKIPVVCKDSPGFIVNRVARPFYIESLRLAEEGIAGYTQIDSLLEASGFKLGPFKLMDLIGNDINYTVSCSVYDQLGQPERLQPSPLQKEKVEKGELGKKTGKGYYNY
jgi:3-hydroxybutyryl-CoA dehydrogenase